LGVEHSMEGKLSEFYLPELIEISCFHQKTGRLEVKYATKVAAFYFNKGELIHAKVDASEGAEAVYLALNIPTAGATFKFDSGVTSIRHTIKTPWRVLLAEAAKRTDKIPGKAIEDKQSKPNNSTNAPIDITIDVADIVVEEPSKNGLNESTKHDAVEPTSTGALPVVQTSDENNNAKRQILYVALGLLFLIIVFGVGLFLFDKRHNEDKVNKVDNRHLTVEVLDRTSNFKPVVPVDLNNISRNAEGANHNGSYTTDPTQPPMTLQPSTTRPSKPQEKKDNKSVAKSGSTQRVMVKIFVDQTGNVTKAAVVGGGGSAAAKNDAVRLAMNRRYDAGKSYSMVVPIIVKEP
jgi:hypothetical protein